MINGAVIRLIPQISKVLLHAILNRSPFLHIGKKIKLASCPKLFYGTIIKIGQYNCIKQTASSEFKVMSCDRVSNIPFKMHMFLLSWDPTLGFMHCLDQHKFLEYPWGLNMKGVGIQMAEDQFKCQLKYENKCVNC